MSDDCCRACTTENVCRYLRTCVWLSEDCARAAVVAAANAALEPVAPSSDRAAGRAQQPEDGADDQQDESDSDQDGQRQKVADDDQDDAENDHGQIIRTLTLQRTEYIPGGIGAMVGYSDEFPGRKFILIPESAKRRLQESAKRRLQARSRELRGRDGD